MRKYWSFKKKAKTRKGILDEIFNVPVLEFQIETGKLSAIGIGIGCGVSDYVNDIQFSIGAGVWIWFSIYHSWLERLYGKISNFESCWNKDSVNYSASGGRDTGITIWSDHISLEWNRYRMNGQTGSKILFYIDWLLGIKKRMSSRIIKEFVTRIEMPEKNYLAKFTHHFEMWKRKRVPWAQMYHKALIEMNEPIPIPGKGESEWDLEDSYIESVSLPMVMYEKRHPNRIATIAKFREDILKRRRKYGGIDWRPDKDKKEEQNV